MLPTTAEQQREWDDLERFGLTVEDVPGTVAGAVCVRLIWQRRIWRARTIEDR